VQECSLYQDGRPAIFPFALVTYDLIEHTPAPPHTEDYLFDPARVHSCGVLPADTRREFLCRTVSPDVAAIFGVPINKDAGHYVPDGAGVRSLGTVRVRQPVTVTLQPEGAEALKPRLQFCDEAGTSYLLAVTDLAWRYYAEHRQRTTRSSPEMVARELQASLQDVEVFLRIGLARGWSRHPDRCYLQITGIHTFPDYLCGRTFADFAPPPADDDW
jgi:hypothetical protein